MNSWLKDLLIRSPAAAVLAWAFWIYRTDMVKIHEDRMRAMEKQVEVLAGVQQAIAYFGQEIARLRPVHSDRP